MKVFSQFSFRFKIENNRVIFFEKFPKYFLSICIIRPNLLRMKMNMPLKITSETHLLYPSTSSYSQKLQFKNPKSELASSKMHKSTPANKIRSQTRQKCFHTLGSKYRTKSRPENAKCGPEISGLE